MTSLTFLGSGDSQGVPRWWCDCSVCDEARNTGKNARTRPSALLQGAGERILLDAAPELRLQMIRQNLESIDAILITHAHNDHILGLGDVADRARWTGKGIPIFAPATVIPHIQERFGYLQRGSYSELVPMLELESTSRSFAGFNVKAHRVPHGANGFAYGFRFESEAFTWAYVPDSISLTDLTPWRELDLLILGTSFYKENAALEKCSVYDVQEVVALLKKLKPKRTVFTHLGHGVDVRKAAPKGTRYAFDGLRLEL